MPPQMPVEYAQHYALGSLGRLLRLATADGQVRIVQTAQQVREAIADGAFAIELHLEGAEPVDTSCTPWTSMPALG
ncbi:MAG: hypothetical protein KatS3mg059_1488 [Thermomicrobiales bacterium]|nr:MAG: hypothetical protein KatS3mg059_1488 [Thermomicrobiales bacterium]